MNDYPRWKHLLVALVTVLGILYAVPSLFQKQPAVQVIANKGALIDEALKERALQAMQERKISFGGVEIKDERLQVGFPNTDSQLAAASALRTDLGDKYTVALNLASTVPQWMRMIGANSMPLGLDLQGGVHFLMQVDQKSVLDAQEQRYVDDIRSLIRDREIRNAKVSRAAQGLIVQAANDADRDAIAAAIARDLLDLNVIDGPSIGDQPTLNVTVKPERIKAIADQTIKQNVATLRNRINSLGVAEPVIVQQGSDRIVVELPGVQDTAEAKKLLGATATLEYRAVDENTNVAEAVRTGSVPPDSRIYYWKDGSPAVLKKKVIVTGDELVDASSAVDEQTGTPAVSVVLNSTGARKMLDFTTQNVGKGMAVVLVERTPEVRIVDGKEVRSAKITEEIINLATIRGVFSNRFQTTGLESMKGASDLALMLRSGSLAAPVDIVQERVIGSTLGADNISKGVTAVLVGLALVVVFVALYYKVFGLIADVALLMNLILLVAILSVFQATLTLPGIAGIVLTLGMAIDANVLICERIREELRNGITPQAAIRAGYEKAWATILDANVTHLIAAFGLMTFGSGPIRGFAITLTIGILTSMFTSVTGTHSLVALVFGRSSKLKSLPV
ncbi:MAG: protein translocase subunit SecD [Dokdonella sp.]|jgi:preprotein translocase subunit SecD|uniref:protein translocase subunit SecD n=1 Tax=Dokdonella sp. TaxID=2291710 RepID=UPI001B6E56EE|nr:protein translocase subunit SecD [Dokdonella sp.]MBK8124646.1 protein translocase subunit SecD [Dokdonella sp.]MBP6326003.1 protein translocase subunit SecD [Dokdonella sp.]MBP6330137.1 protein translocase subunit SecD [Dokdonella sp.]HNV09480.1 protein translocase subunit SecD [Dokdonella sp.]HPW04748.1 protein translocase subunit SecD [Dokdonella sp.]